MQTARTFSVVMNDTKYTFAQARQSLCHSTRMACAGLNGDLCTVYVKSECFGEAAPATTAHLCNHQCVLSMHQKCSLCIVIQFLNKSFACLPRKKERMIIVFWMLYHGNMGICA